MGAAQEGGKDHGFPLGLARDHQSDLLDLRSNPGQADHCHLDTDVCSGPSAVVGQRSWAGARRGLRVGWWEGGSDSA